MDYELRLNSLSTLFGTCDLSLFEVYCARSEGDSAALIFTNVINASESKKFM